MRFGRRCELAEPFYNVSDVPIRDAIGNGVADDLRHLPLTEQVGYQFVESPQKNAVLPPDRQNVHASGRAVSAKYVAFGAPFEKARESNLRRRG